MSVDKDYEDAKENILRNKKVPVSHKQRLELYGFFRQAEVGDCATPPPSQNNIINYQKWMEHSKHKGLSKDEAKVKYVELVVAILKMSSNSSASGAAIANPKLPPALPPLTFKAAASPVASKEKAKPKEPERSSKEKEDKNAKTRELVQEAKAETNLLKEVETITEADDEEKEDEQAQNKALPELPPVKKPTAAKQDEEFRAELFRSRAFSSVAGLNNPLVENEDIEKKYLLYEKIRAFYAKHDPDRVKRGLGTIVEWAMSHGEKALNENLKKKYGSNLADMESRESIRMEKVKEDDKKRRESQLILSKRLIATKDTETRKKMDKLTRFLLVNDPDLVSRGMYLMLRFIEAKGLGALNENLKQQYGKSLDSVSDDELNAQLKKIYGNDLDMLNKPFSPDENTDPNRRFTSDAEEAALTLTEQIQNLDPDKLRETQLKQAQSVKDSQISRKSKKSRKSRKNENHPPPKTTNESFDSTSYQHTLTPKDKYLDDFNKYKDMLQAFVEKYEPYRYAEAFQLMSDFLKRNGIEALNNKLQKKYDVDLISYQKISVDLEANMSDEEFDLKVLQFVTKHENEKNIERAIKAMKDYRKRQGIAALNTKLYVKYGETLNDVMLEESAPGGRAEKGLSMVELHRIDLPNDFKEKLKSYYAKYDPMILGNEGVERIFEWAERNGTKALDEQLKAKYKESLSDFISTEAQLKRELEQFYLIVDKKKLGTKQVDSVLAWAIINGRDALNYNLRRKYDKDLDSVLAGGSNTSVNRSNGTLDI